MAVQNSLPRKVSIAADSVIPSLGVQLSKTSSINMKATGQTTLYTVPTGKSCVVTHVLIRVTSASNVTGVPVITVGITSGWNSIRTSTTLTNLDATGEYYLVQCSQPAAVTAAGGVIKLDVATGATTTGGGDTYVAEVRLFGFLF